MALESEKKGGVSWRALITRGAALAIPAEFIGAYAAILRPAPSASTILTLVGMALVAAFLIIQAYA